MPRRLHHYSTCIGRRGASTLVLESGKPHVLMSSCLVWLTLFLLCEYIYPRAVGRSFVIIPLPAQRVPYYARTLLSYNQSSYKYKF